MIMENLHGRRRKTESISQFYSSEKEILADDINFLIWRNPIFAMYYHLPNTRILCESDLSIGENYPKRSRIA
jgi:hypothetical protein